MTEGVVSGGWSFVAAAYAITVAALLGYGMMLLLQLRKLASDGARDQR